MHAQVLAAFAWAITTIRPAVCVETETDVWHIPLGTNYWAILIELGSLLIGSTNSTNYSSASWVVFLLSFLVSLLAPSIISIGTVEKM